MLINVACVNFDNKLIGELSILFVAEKRKHFSSFLIIICSSKCFNLECPTHIVLEAPAVYFCLAGFLSNYTQNPSM